MRKCDVATQLMFIYFLSSWTITSGDHDFLILRSLELFSSSFFSKDKRFFLIIIQRKRWKPKLIKVLGAYSVAYLDWARQVPNSFKRLSPNVTWRGREWKKNLWTYLAARNVFLQSLSYSWMFSVTQKLTSAV